MLPCTPVPVIEQTARVSNESLAVADTELVDASSTDAEAAVRYSSDESNVVDDSAEVAK